jgi:hypothetical protein
MQMNENRLDALFADLRSIEATPSDALTANLIADARREAELRATARSTAVERPPPRAFRCASSAKT